MNSVNIGHSALSESWARPVTDPAQATSFTESGLAHFRAKDVLTAENEDKARNLVSLLNNEAGDMLGTWQHNLKEAMGVADFPNIFGDTLARELRTMYRASDPGLMRIAKPGRVPDFRPKSIYQSLGWNGTMQVVPENGEYPLADRTDETPVTYAVKKYGQQASLSFETWTDGQDLNLFGDTVQRYADSSIHTRNRFITEKIADSTGPLDANFAITVATAALSIDSLSVGMQAMMAQTISPSPTETAVPIIARPKYLMVPPALEMAARTILNSTEVRVTGPADSGQSFIQRGTSNVVSDFGIELIVNPWLPIISTTNGSTSWYLFTDPSEIPFVEIGSLLGHEEPEAWVKAPDARLLTSGAEVGQFAGSFDTDAIQYRLRYIFGGAAVDGKAGYASNGTA